MISTRAVRVSLTLLTLFSLGALLVACGGGSSKSSATNKARDSSAASGATDAPKTSSRDSTSAATNAKKSSGQAATADLSNVDACSLLTADEVGSLVPQPTSKALPASAGAVSEIGCRWEGAVPSGAVVPPDLVLTVAAMPAGVPLDDVKLALTAEAKSHGKVIDGLGDIGVVESVIPGQATLKAVANGVLFSLDLSAQGAEEQLDAVASLGKAALGRLG